MIDGMLQGDYSQFYSSEPVETGFRANMGRNWLGQFLGMGADSDMEDWKRNEQSANNAFVRDMLAMQEQNIFNANEAQKSRDFQERMSNTAYQRAVSDMKLAGINPVFAFQQGGASTPSGVSASSGSSGGRSGSSVGSRDRSGSGAAALIANLVGGIVAASAKLTAAGISASAASQPKVSYSYKYYKRG